MTLTRCEDILIKSTCRERQSLHASHRKSIKLEFLIKRHIIDVASEGASHKNGKSFLSLLDCEWQIWRARYDKEEYHCREQGIAVISHLFELPNIMSTHTLFKIYRLYIRNTTAFWDCWCWLWRKILNFSPSPATLPTFIARDNRTDSFINHSHLHFTARHSSNQPWKSSLISLLFDAWRNFFEDLMGVHVCVDKYFMRHLCCEVCLWWKIRMNFIKKDLIFKFSWRDHQWVGSHSFYGSLFFLDFDLFLGTRGLDFLQGYFCQI
jgi:hypothetical protein